jgi:hypothetical protein
MKLIPLAVLAATLTLAGCTNWERDSYNALATSAAVITQAHTDYQSGAIKNTTAAYNAINAAEIAQNTAVNEMVAYEELKATGASAGALQTAEVEASAGIAQLPTIIAQIKALYGTGGQ